MKTKNIFHFTQEQDTKILENAAQGKDDFNKVLSLNLGAIIRSDQKIHNNGRFKYGAFGISIL